MTMATRAPCEGRETHHLGCECHEAKRDAEVAALRAEVERLRADLREEERDAADAATDRTIAEEVSRALYLAARAAGFAGGDHWEEGDGTRRGEEMLALVRAAARRKGAEEMLARCRAVAREAFDSHWLTLDSRHEPGCICDAIGRGSCSECDRGDAVVDALDALPLDAPAAAPANGGVS